MASLPSVRGTIDVVVVPGRIALDAARRIERLLVSVEELAGGVQAMEREFRGLRSDMREVIDGVEMDLEPLAFATFDDLAPYCYRVASAVGLACLPVWGTTGDATELPITVQARSLTSEARNRGPKQDRADLCVLPDGSAMLAEAEFENHEATASVLADLGCPLAVALDRGAERVAWSEDQSAKDLTQAHTTTVLFALGRPLPGSLSTAR